MSDVRDNVARYRRALVALVTIENELRRHGIEPKIEFEMLETGDPLKIVGLKKITFTARDRATEAEIRGESE